MSYKYLNLNPAHLNTGDCTIRAISLLMNQSWEWTYFMVCLQGFLCYMMPSTNEVWSEYLHHNGYIREVGNGTVNHFCLTHPYGRYLLALNGHVVAVIDGVYYDTWDSGNEIVLYYWTKGELKNERI